ncbi:hypothetical protein [Herbaspirillum sp. NPDC101397]|uniref:hypothetical protein n=1 Tax=Herbaspirillum sp. NPDC101397 TaxID=3364006 RepID=UPI00383B787A
MQRIKNYFLAFGTRLKALVDKSALLLILPAMLILGVLDLPKTAAIASWMLFGAVLVGFCIQISRIAWSPLDFTALVDKAMEDSRACATIVAAIIIFVGLLFLSLAFWTRP